MSALQEAERQRAALEERIDQLTRKSEFCWPGSPFQITRSTVLHVGNLQTESERRTAAESRLAAGGLTSPPPQDPGPGPTPGQLLAQNILLALPEWAEDAEDGSIPRPKGELTRLWREMSIPQEHKKFYSAIRASFVSCILSTVLTHHALTALPYLQTMFTHEMGAAKIAWHVYAKKQNPRDIQAFLVKVSHDLRLVLRPISDYLISRLFSDAPRDTLPSAICWGLAIHRYHSDEAQELAANS